MHAIMALDFGENKEVKMKKFLNYTRNAIANYQARLQHLADERAEAIKRGDGKRQLELREEIHFQHLAVYAMALFQLWALWHIVMG